MRTLSELDRDNLVRGLDVEDRCIGNRVSRIRAGCARDLSVAALVRRGLLEFRECVHGRWRRHPHTTQLGRVALRADNLALMELEKMK